jgi:hypothetical protein
MSKFRCESSLVTGADHPLGGLEIPRLQATGKLDRSEAPEPLAPEERAEQCRDAFGSSPLPGSAQPLPVRIYLTEREWLGGRSFGVADL